MSERQVLVPDVETAIQIAEAIWGTKYGEQIVAKYRPYHAKLEGNIWIVSGTAQDTSTRGGGMPTIEISRVDGRIENVYLSR